MAQDRILATSSSLDTATATVRRGTAALRRDRRRQSLVRHKGDLVLHYTLLYRDEPVTNDSDNDFNSGLALTRLCC